MAEDSVGTCPQVFVVDSQASYVSVPMSGKNPRKVRLGQRFLLLLVGFALLGLIIEGFFIYSLHRKTEELSLCKLHPLCQNLSNPQTSGQQGGTVMGHVGPKDSNEIPTVQPHVDQVQDRPFAQLIGTNTQTGVNSVVLWENKNGESVTHNMDYNNGRLLIKEDGYYYLYSKVTLNAGEDCLFIQHKVMKDTRAYNRSIPLMRSKSHRCRITKSPSAKATDAPQENMWNSFLAGIFHLQSGDDIFVTLDKIHKMHSGPTDNLMGAFMIFPGDILQ